MTGDGVSRGFQSKESRRGTRGDDALVTRKLGVLASSRALILPSCPGGAARKRLEDCLPLLALCGVDADSRVVSGDRCERRCASRREETTTKMTAASGMDNGKRARPGRGGWGLRDGLRSVVDDDCDNDGGPRRGR